MPWRGGSAIKAWWMLRVTARGRWLRDDAMRKPVAVGMAVGRSSRMDAKVAAVKKEVKVGGDFETRGLFCAEEIAELRHRLLAWYDVNHRILPWRKNPHSKRSDRDAGHPPPEDKSDFAYCVWVSEGTLHYELRFSLIVRLGADPREHSLPNTTNTTFSHAAADEGGDRQGVLHALDGSLPNPYGPRGGRP